MPATPFPGKHRREGGRGLSADRVLRVDVPEASVSDAVMLDLRSTTAFAVPQQQLWHLYGLSRGDSADQVGRTAAPG